MGVFGGYQVGKAFLVDRRELMAALERISASGAVAASLARKQRVLAAVNEASRRAVAASTEIRTDPAVFRRRPPELPAAIEIVAPGKVQISYHGAEDLLAQIVELASAAANDFPRFREMFEEPAR